MRHQNQTSPLLLHPDDDRRRTTDSNQSVDAQSEEMFILPKYRSNQSGFLNRLLKPLVRASVASRGRLVRGAPSCKSRSSLVDVQYERRAKPNNTMTENSRPALDIDSSDGHKSLVIITGELILYTLGTYFFFIHSLFVDSLSIYIGASRGIGRAIALAIIDAVAQECCVTNDETSAMTFLSTPIHMVLISRSQALLGETAQLVEERGLGLISATCHEIDLSDLDTLDEKLQAVLESLSGAAQYHSCWLINNAGSLGPLGLANTFSGASTMKELRQAVDFNLTSTIWISSQFTQTFLTPSAAAGDMTTQSPFIRIVNISSSCGIEPFPTMSVYCAGKAGREMFHRVLANEHSLNCVAANQQYGSNKRQQQIFKTLNYAPGPCGTEMTDILADSSVLDKNLHKFFVTSKRERNLVRVEDTAKKLIQIMKSDKYESGEHIDYFDVITN